MSKSGKTCDHVIVSADASAWMALSKKQFYVSVSRGTQGVTLFTDDLKKFKQAINQTADRTLVIEEMKKSKLDKIQSLFLNKFEKLGLTKINFPLKWKNFIKNPKVKLRSQAKQVDKEKEHELEI
jgi:hypothetical protein